MYINKIDELIDKMFDLFYSEISSKITKQENFAQSRQIAGKTPPAALTSG